MKAQFLVGQTHCRGSGKNRWAFLQAPAAQILTIKNRAAGCKEAHTYHGGTEDRVIGTSGHRIIGSSEQSEEKNSGKAAMTSASDEPMNRSPDEPILFASVVGVLFPAT
jgi:hypothetical protein